MKATNNKFFKLLCLTLALFVLLTSFGITVFAEEEAEEVLTDTPVEDVVITQEDINSSPDYLNFQNGNGYPKMDIGKAPEAMEKVAENAKFTLYANMKNGFFCVEEKATGYRLYSNPPEDIKINQSGLETNNLKSQAIITTAIPQGQSTKTRPTYSFSVKEKTMEAELIENGVKFKYVSYEDVAKFKFTYTPVDAEGNKITAEAKEITPEETKDYDFHCITSEEIKEAVEDFSVTLYVTIDENGLVAKVPINEITECGKFEKSVEAVISANAKKDLSYKSTCEKVEIKQQETNEKAWKKGEEPMQLPTPTPPVYETVPTIDDQNLVYKIELLPFMGTVIGSGDGYMFVPDGSGSILRFTNPSKINTKYHARLCGTDEVKATDSVINVHEPLMLPVVGIKGYEYGFIAIAESGIGNAWANAAFCGQNADCNRTYFEFDLRYTDTFMIGDTGNGWGTKDVNVYQKDKITLDEIAVRYMFVGAEENDYVGMARTYREYLLAFDEFKREVPDEAPFFLSLHGSVRKTRSVLGIPIVITEVYTTLDRANDIVKELNDNNIGSLYLLLTGWSESEIRGKIQNGFDPVGKIGGKAKLNTLINSIEEYNDKIFLNAEAIYLKSGGNGVSWQWNTARNINAVSANVYYFRRNVFLKDPSKGITKLTMPSLIKEKLSKTADEIAKYNSSVGIAPLSATSTLYNDFGNAANPGNSRDTMRRNVDDAMRDISGKLSVLGSSTFGQYLGQVTATINTPMTNTGFMIALESIPFYQIVLHGYVPYATRPLNQYGNHTEMFLKAVETGSYLYYSLIGGDPSLIKDTEYNYMFSTDYEYWKPIMLEEQAKIAQIHALVGKETITAHKTLENGAKVTTYSNGVEIVVNYNKTKTANYNGKTIEPMNYIIIEGGK